ncbi:MAG: nucleotidyltransferase family protein [Eubacteriales bacterium]
MRNVGIICEYNPLHGGHKYMIDRLRDMGAERVICLMSGNSVQRGDFAVLPKHERALCAVKAGADAALELPYPYSSGGAEFFAGAGVDILARLGVDTVAFGSESGDLDRLEQMAAKSEGFVPSEDKSVGIAADYFAALGAVGPNEVLGIEYLKAGKRRAPKMQFVTVKREGAGYRDVDTADEYPSATELRRAIAGGELDKYSSSQLPDESRSVIEGVPPVFMKSIESAVLAFWRMCDAESVVICAECGGGVAQRLKTAANESATLEEFFKAAATKRYTDSHLRRAALFGMTGVTAEDLKARPAFTSLLAANRSGIEFLSEVKGIEVVSKPSKIPPTEESARQFLLGARLDALYTLAMKKESGYFLRQSPKII